MTDFNAGEGRVERRLAGRLVAIPHQLQVELRGDRRAAGIDHLMPYGDVVSTAFERVGFHQLDAADIG